MRTITCYSYKGGTGRTLLVANLAVFAAQLGQKVVTVDFDLEAPGLAYKLPGVDPPRPGPGLVGWLTDGYSSGEAPAELADYLHDVPVEGALVSGGWLRFMPAGRAPSPNYFQDLRRLRLEQRLDDGSAIDALLELQRQIGDDLGADLLMIDARTGITPSNRVTTHVLADEVVVLTLPSDEQLHGTRSVLRSLVPLHSVRTEEPIGLHAVLSRVVPRPASAGIFVPTDAEREMVERTLAFLTEPAVPLASTIELDRLHLLHSDPSLAREEFLFLGERGQWNRSVTHVDYFRIAEAVLGSVLTDAAADVLTAARGGGDARAFEETAHYLADPAAVAEARAARSAAQPGPASVDPTLLEEIATLRSQAEADPAAHRPDLASALNDLGVQLSDLGRREEALAPAQEAVDLRRALANVNPAAHRPDLAMALSNLGVLLGDLGRREEALAPAQEAVDHYRALAETNPAAYVPGLATALNNLSSLLGDLGRREEALVPTEEAVDLRRPLAEANPAAHQPALAMALNNLGAQLGDLGRREEALAPAQEAVDHYRALAEADPAAHQPNLAAALDNLGIRLGDLGRREEALAPAQEAVDHYRALAEADPAAHQPDLAAALSNLGFQLGELGRREEALAPAQEAADLRRPLAEASPAAHQPALASALNHLGVRLGELGRREEALASAQEAVDHYRAAVADDPAAHRPGLARRR